MNEPQKKGALKPFMLRISPEHLNDLQSYYPGVSVAHIIRRIVANHLKLLRERLNREEQS